MWEMCGRCVGAVCGSSVGAEWEIVTGGTGDTLRGYSNETHIRALAALTYGMGFSYR